MSAEIACTSASLVPLVKHTKSTGVQTGPTDKNLVVCIDGCVPSKHGQRNTNVARLFDIIDLKTFGPRQHAVYYGGVDTVSTRNVDEDIKRAYGWLAASYEEGDRIFLFGFSRGACQICALAGIIHEVGLIRTPTERQVIEAYDYYGAIRPGNSGARQMARKFKKKFCWDDVKVHFIGAWDMVSSMRYTRVMSFPTSSSARFIRHALALDECGLGFEHFRETDLDFVDSLDIYHVSASKPDSNIKEVWFAGNHSDVGGLDEPGQTYHPGNISLTWMYREAAVHGLRLHPIDIVWGPDDIGFGPTLRVERISKPRLILPHQKVHASVLYAHTYKPVAARVRGLDIPMMDEAPEDRELDLSWETDMFGDMDAQVLMNSLRRRRLGVTLLFDKLLFMLRLEGGKRRIKSVPDWQDEFEGIIEDRDCAPSMRLVAIVAYYEASCDSSVSSQSPSRPRKVLSQSIFTAAKECLSSIFAEPKHQYNLRMVALLNPLTRHEDLRNHILTQDVLESFVGLVDLTIAASIKRGALESEQLEHNFIHVVNGLNNLLLCETTRDTMIAKLRNKYPNSNVSRLWRMSEVNNSRDLVALLRLILTLARIQDARDTCVTVERRVCELAKTRSGLVGTLAAEIWLILYDHDGRRSLEHPRVRKNIVSALVRKNFKVRELASVIGLDVKKFDERQKKVIGILARDVQKRNIRLRTAMTITLLKLCETPIVRAYLNEIDLVGRFVDQLQHENSALLAAYALATCLEYSDMEALITQKRRLSKYIVNMLKLDLFDGAIGQVEGLRVFARLMRNSSLRRDMMDHNLMETLGSKAGKDQLRRVLFALLHADRNLISVHSKELIEKGLELLRNPDWKVQRTGVTILTGLVQIPNGAELIELQHVQDIIKMIIPNSYLKNQMQEIRSPDSLNAPFQPASGMMGPVCVLRNLALNKLLRLLIRNSREYFLLGQLYLPGTLTDGRETSPWLVHTPTKSDIMIVLHQVIETVEGGSEGEDMLWIGDTLPPDIQHWGRAFRYVAAKITLLPVLFGVSMLSMSIRGYTVVNRWLGKQKILSLKCRQEYDQSTPGSSDRIDPSQPIEIHPEGALPRPDRFRILIIGRANAGKTTLLRAICNSAENPEVYDGRGNKIDLTQVEGSTSRGMHDIENELIFRSNDKLIFHDSRGFEAGFMDEFLLLKKFIADRASATSPEKRIHAIWYCIPMDKFDRAIQRSEEMFFNECDIGDVPVIVVFTKFDGLVATAMFRRIRQESYRLLSREERMIEARSLAEHMFQEAGLWRRLSQTRYPPKHFVRTEGMHKSHGASEACGALLEATANVLNVSWADDRRGE